jgi:hypothetical protein
MTRPRTSDVRKAIPLSVQIVVYQRTVRELMGLAPQTKLHVDHQPALGIREWDEAKGDFDPPQLDPDHLFIKAEAAHREKTSGKRHTSYGSDVHAIAKIDRIIEKRAAGETFAREVLRIGAGRKHVPRSRWGKRRFQTRKKHDNRNQDQDHLWRPDRRARVQMGCAQQRVAVLVLAPRADLPARRGGQDRP